MLALERRNLILEKLQTEKKVVVSELSQIFSVSEETIRRDLDKISKDGFAVKSYGGAFLNENTNIELPFNVRKKHNVEAKQKIATIIETLVSDGDHIILDASTTAVFIAKMLKQKKNLTVITNSVEIIIELSDMPDWNIISSGGSLKNGYLALFGPQASQTFASYNTDTLILSCKGISMDKGITDVNDTFSQVKQAMIQSAKTKILAVNYSKFGEVAFSKIGDVTLADIVVTDRKPSDEWFAFFETNKIKCVYTE